MIVFVKPHTRSVNLEQAVVSTTVLITQWYKSDPCKDYGQAPAGKMKSAHGSSVLKPHRGDNFEELDVDGVDF
jgi:hypothetical protein